MSLVKIFLTLCRHWKELKAKRDQKRTMSLLELLFTMKQFRHIRHARQKFFIWICHFLTLALSTHAIVSSSDSIIGICIIHNAIVLRKITRRTTTSERNKFLQVIARFRKNILISSNRLQVTDNESQIVCSKNQSSYRRY